MKKTCLIPVLLTTLPACVCFSRAAPQIIWASDPVRPGETLVVMGEGFTSNSVVELNDPSTPGAWAALTVL